MLQPGYSSLQEKPRARFLRRAGGLLLVAGLALNVSMLIRGAGFDLHLAMLVLAPGVILFFTAFLVENTPSLRGCLTVVAVSMAFIAGFWAWVGVTVALSPEDEPPALLQGSEPAANDAAVDEMPAEPSSDSAD